SMAVSLGLFASLPERLRRDLSDCPLPGAPDMSSPENLMAESLVLTGSAWARPEKTAEKA
ncbi:MAG: hypothetical protein J6Y62_04010, partial [Clostridia bacterium]|nr:hypothetical protein [Clostridia bacterium]